jgi:hypothetical protein
MTRSLLPLLEGGPNFIIEQVYSPHLEHDRGLGILVRGLQMLGAEVGTLQKFTWIFLHILCVAKWNGHHRSNTPEWSRLKLCSQLLVKDWLLEKCPDSATDKSQHPYQHLQKQRKPLSCLATGSGPTCLALTCYRTPSVGCKSSVSQSLPWPPLWRKLTVMKHSCRHFAVSFLMMIQTHSV